ncbi:MAG: 4-(cytidine 5'-diphospho)-2-C-methyl-D-erythritol kinase [Lachnospiraceae bacterium]|nr:4-(cytidine 5'-diphospho)-2-C-methyl-D-erythritol kinase [Lachnospiraceae bacterium]
MDHITLRSMAKINLGLDVVRRRPDGYHDLRMIMQTVRLSDRITMEKTREDAVELSCSLPFLPADSRNLAWRAAALLRDEFDLREGVRIRLEKHIPVAAGLAGGSGNAAAVLFGMNRLFDLGLSDGQLRERGLTLGADVPYCLMRGTALAEGVGEILTPLPPLPDCTVLLVKPNISVSTGYVFTHLRLDETTVHPDIDGMRAAIEAGSLPGVISRLGNVLETVTVPAYPEIAAIKASLTELGAEASLMSGSGPTVFGIFTEESRARAAADELRLRYPSAFVRFAGLYQPSGEAFLR